MKTRFAVLVLLLLVASASAQQPIEGAFGKKLGEKITTGIQDKGEGKYIVFSPDAPFPSLNFYSASLTPISNVIYSIVATGPSLSDGALAEILRTLESKYGKFTLQGTGSDGVSKHWGRDVGERTVGFVITGTRDVYIIYRDRSLEAAAKIEASTGKAADGIKGL
jgi:hypothetical protein